MAEAALGIALVALVVAALAVAVGRQVARDLDALARRHFAVADGSTTGASPPDGRAHPEVIRVDDDRPIIVLAVDPSCLSCGDRVGDLVAASAAGVRRILLVLALGVPPDWRVGCDAAGVDVITRADLTSEWIIVATPVLILVDPDGREVRRRVADSAETINTFLPTPEPAHGGTS